MIGRLADLLVIRTWVQKREKPFSYFDANFEGVAARHEPPPRVRTRIVSNAFAASACSRERVVALLEKKRPTVLTEEKIEKFVIRMLHFDADGYEVRLMMPAAAWDDLFPIAAGILKSARLPKEKGK